MDDANAQKAAGVRPWLSGGLSFVAGFADTASFVGAAGIFCAHVTGNFVVLAAELARGARADEWLKLATFPLFVAAVLRATKVAATRSAGSARTLMLVTAVLLAAAAGVGLLGHPTSGLAKTAIVSLLVLAMGTQNAMHRLHPALGPMTTVMTGNVTGFLVDAVGPKSSAQSGKQRVGATIIAGFAFGCAAGAFGVAKLGFVVLVVPALVTLAVRARLPR